MTNKLQQNYPQFFELNGTALNDGYIYIGSSGLDPITNPIQVYLDANLTTPISQPLRTTGGYIYYGGSPVSIYFVGTYSITVKNSLNELIYTNLHAFDYINSKISYKDGIYIVSNIANLKSTDGATTPQVDVLGYYTKGDGGGGAFYWDSTSTEADNGGTIIQATGIATGRWKRPIESTIKPRQYGLKCDGITNDTTAFNNMMSSLTSLKALELTPSDIIKLDTMEWKYSKCNIMGNGATFDFSSSTATYAVTFEQDVVNIYRAFCNNVKFKGNATTHAFKLEGSITGHLANINFDGITIYQFDRQLEIGRSCSNIHFTNSLFTCDGAMYRQSTAIYLTANANANTGEQISFKGCQLSSHKNIVDNHESGCLGAINFNQCSLVYFDRCFYNAKGLRISVNQGSIESNVHTNYWFECLDNNSHISIKGTEFVFSATGGVSKEIFNITDTSQYNGLNIDDCTYTSVSIGIPFFCTLLDGAISVTNWRHGNGEAIVPFSYSKKVNQLAYQTWESAILPTFVPYSDNFATATITSEETYNGNVVKLATAGAGNVKFTQTIPIEGGTDLVASLVAKTSGVTGMGIYFSLLDDALNVIGTGTVYEGGNITDWTLKPIHWTETVPKGAKYCQFNYYSASTGGAQSIYLSTICINCL